MLTEPIDVNQAAIKHFQTAAGTINEHRTIPQDWIEEYTPIAHIDELIYDPLTNEINHEEFLNIIAELPNNKACGPTTISNEMIKHFPESMLQLTRRLFNDCLRLNDIPNEWKNATIYPIPKPKE